MAIEIERKFLVVGDFMPAVQRSCRMVQGYLCADKERTVRIRISDRQGYLTIKSAPDARGWSRYEFEREIPLPDAEAMLGLCLPGTIDKVRHYIPAGRHTWEVDVFRGDNEGLVVAELELESADEPFDRPDWLGGEVTGDPRYSNALLARNPYTLWGTPEPK